MNVNYSNTILNAYRSYQQKKGCGKQIMEIYINKTVNFKTSDEQQAGQWFEYITTGATLRNGVVPEPIILTKGGLAAISKHLEGQKVNFENIYSDIKIDSISKELIYEEGVRKFKAILDVLAYFNNETSEHIRDIKTSGLLDNKWEDSGWEMLNGEGSYIPKKKHIYQAKFYIWIWFKLTGNIVDFYFDVFSNKNSNDCKTIKIKMDSDTLEYFETELMQLISELETDLKKGLKAYPDMKRCSKCPEKLNKICEFKVNKPQLEEYYL